MSRTWIVGMSGPGSLANLQAMWEPIKHAFSGIVWVLHDSRGSWEHSYLEETKGAGEVIHAKYCRRHDWSRNTGLYCGPIQEGDWCLVCDGMERVAVPFANQFAAFTASLTAQGVNSVFYHGKYLAFQYHESLRFQGNPHECVVRDDGGLRGIELSQYYPTETDVRYGVRNGQRDPYHFVGHYAKYFLFPWGANHALLGLVNRGDERALFPIREKLRLEFLAEMTKRGFPKTLDGLKAMLSAPLDDTLKSFLNREKVWQDYFRYEILGDQTVRDEHEWTSLKVIV